MFINFIILVLHLFNSKNDFVLFDAHCYGIVALGSVSFTLLFTLRCANDALIK